MNKQINYANRGQSLETEINYTNQMYLMNDIAIIHKKPTPVQVLKVKYPENKIVLGYFQKPSTTDYNGLYKGKYIDFEAKETKSKTSFPISNIHEHQIKHLIDVHNHKGISFLLISFSAYNEVYLLHTSVILNYIKNDKKSISYNDIKKLGHLVESTNFLILDYLKIIYEFYWENE